MAAARAAANGQQRLAGCSRLATTNIEIVILAPSLRAASARLPLPMPSADAAEDDVAVETRIMPLEPAPNASSRGTVVEAQVRLAKSKIEPVILAPVRQWSPSTVHLEADSDQYHADTEGKTRQRIGY